jgi:hypothetical protein
MIRLFSVLVLGIAVCAFTAPAIAEDKPKEVKLEGNICCGKCELKESKACAVTIVTEKDGKKTTYWFDTKASKKYHGDVCQEVKAGTVTGTVKKVDEKNVITVTDLKYK